MKRILLVLAVALAAVFTVGGAALASSDTGFWFGNQDYQLALGANQADINVFFLGGYTAGHFTGTGFGGDYRFTYGVSDRLRVGDAYRSENGSFYYFDATSSVKFTLEQGFYLRLGAGTTAWWGYETVGSSVESYTFLQARAGAGLGTSLRLARVTLETAADVFLVFDYVRDHYDFGDSFLLEGLRTDLGLNVVYEISRDFTVRSGLKYKLTADEVLLYPTTDNGLTTGFEGYVGVAWGF